MPTRRFVRLLFLTLSTLFLFACASNKTMDRLMPQVSNMTMARHYFGEPTSIKELPDGSLHCEWLLDRTVQRPGQLVTERRYIGHDSDGFRKYREREVFVPAHNVEQKCRIIMLVDPAGNVKESTWEGNACEALLRVPTTY